MASARELRYSAGNARPTSSFTHRGGGTQGLRMTIGEDCGKVLDFKIGRHRCKRRRGFEVLQKKK
jgi:hypothetical protein